MGARVVAEPGLLGPAVAAAVLSTVATVAQISIVVAATSPETLLALAVPLTFAGLAAVAYGLIFAFSHSEMHHRRAFEPRRGLQFQVGGAAGSHTWRSCW